MHTDWERFQLGEESTEVRHEILTSWRRSQLSGVDPEKVDLPWMEPTVDTRFAQAAIPVLTRLADLLVGTNTCLAITDPGGQVLWRWVSDRSLRRDLDKMAIIEGFCFGEENAGTNGLGTSLESQHVTTVHGSEHFKEPFHRFTCVAAPVSHPLTHRAVGAVNITCRAEEANDRLQPALLALVREVQEALLHAASTRERALFDAFLTYAQRGAPVITLGPEVLIKNDDAAMIDVDHRKLWERVLDAAEEGGPLELPELDSRTAELKLVAEGPRVSGAVLVLDERAREPRPAAETTAGGRVAASVEQLLDEPGAVVVRGEAGTGKQHLLTSQLSSRSDDHQVLDCAAVPASGLTALTTSIETAVEAGHALLLVHLQVLSSEQADALVAELADVPVRVLGTVAAEGRDGADHLTRLLDALDATVVELPPLRLRTEDVESLATALTPTGTRWSRRALSVLRDHPWPGNVAELKLAVRTAAATAAGKAIGVDHLPASVRPQAQARRLSLLEQAEAAVISDVLAAADGNKTAAARKLGLSRPTLYAKLRAYRL